MNTPAAAAYRILLGTGLGLLVISGLLFSMGFLPPENCNSEASSCIPTNSFGWLIPIFSSFFILFGLLIWKKPELFENLFPNYDEEKRKGRIEELLLEEHLEDSKSSSAWTSLEKKLLIEKFEEE
ncbi:MAG: hypothetical protein CMB48_02670 [Euryarchaeota archaeon]|nr:hypothetical protein [Euryarchaeota archaeon]|tara:strand:+ start:151 stop:525 length:375 start_codon:yes stop_codon:yes gene_type:complete